MVEFKKNKSLKFKNLKIEFIIKKSQYWQILWNVKKNLIFLWRNINFINKKKNFKNKNIFLNKKIYNYSNNLKIKLIRN
jgi:hypothetical protein